MDEKYVDRRYCPNPDCLHFRENGRPAEYRLRVEVCTDCGSDLQDQPPVFADEPEDQGADYGQIDTNERLVSVGAFRDPVSLQTGISILQAEGIPFVVVGADASAVFGSVLRRYLQVPESHAQRATDVLAEQGLALRRESPEHVAAVEKHTLEEQRRTGVHPTVWFLWGAALLSLFVLLRWISRQNL